MMIQWLAETAWERRESATGFSLLRSRWFYLVHLRHLRIVISGPATIFLREIGCGVGQLEGKLGSYLENQRNSRSLPLVKLLFQIPPLPPRAGLDSRNRLTERHGRHAETDLRHEPDPGRLRRRARRRPRLERAERRRATRATCGWSAGRRACEANFFISGLCVLQAR